MKIRTKTFKKVFKQLLFFCCILLTFSCTKEFEAKKDKIELDPAVTVNNGRLKFNSFESFKNTMTEMQNSESSDFDEDTRLRLEKAGFREMNYTYNKVGEKEIEHSNKSFAMEVMEEDTLVEDPYFAAVLNEDREVVVDGVVYKVDEYGTFFGPEEKIDEIDAMIDNLDQQEVSELPGEMVADKLHQLDDDIYLYDSFNYNEPDSVGSSTEIIEIADPMQSSSGSSSVYGDIVTYNFEAKTLAGKVIESLFGRSRAHNREFNWRRRIRVNFYSVNYVVYSGIGVNVKFQKKNWIGWSKTECSELRWGWDGLVYKYNLPYSMPLTGPGPVRTEKTGVPGLKGKLAYTVNIFSREITIDFAKSLKDVILSFWNWMDRTLAPQAYEMRQEKIKQFRLLFPSKAIVVVDRYEEIKYNCESFSKVFDWGTCEVSLNFLSGGQWVFQPGLKNNAFDFDVTKASIYGIAKYDGRYKGVRIKKD